MKFIRFCLSIAVLIISTYAIAASKTNYFAALNLDDSDDEAPPSLLLAPAPAKQPPRHHAINLALLAWDVLCLGGFREQRIAAGIISFLRPGQSGTIHIKLAYPEAEFSQAFKKFVYFLEDLYPGVKFSVAPKPAFATKADYERNKRLTE